MARSSTSRLLTPVRRFIHWELAGGIVLLASVLLAIAWANSPWRNYYHHLPHDWINDGLMTLFFFVIGLELKREFLEGELSSTRKAMLPMMAALGGMLVPAVIFAVFNQGRPSGNGWGIPMATDIAFALALLSMAGNRVPASVRIFLSALAVVDDLGAVVVIAFFYTGQLMLVPLLIALGLLLLLTTGNYRGIRTPAFYIVIGIAVWACFLQSGIHATIAGVLVAFTIPNHLTKKLEMALHPWVTFLIMPVFALANAGMAVGPGFFASLVHPVSIGVMIGLVVGKCVGVFGFTWVLIRFRLSMLPAGSTWRHILGVSILAGVGFTMSLFITELAFDDPEMVNQSKYGILLASIVSGLAGLLVLRRSPPVAKGY